jgi:non-canonical (house-cleaning) NTP pyrophosphatase
MKVILASQSPLKIEACRVAFANVADIELVALKVPSHVSEQPFGDETLQGAFNRLNEAFALVQDGDLYIAIENGLFEENGEIVDRAAIMTFQPDDDFNVHFSRSVAFSKRYVLEAQARGFDKVTVGDVMQEHGVIQDAKDPHKSICGTSRKDILVDTLKAVLKL